MAFEFFRRRQPAPEAVPSRPTILPSDVRYALRYREARLGVSEILDLAHNGFEEEAAYVFLKAAARDTQLQHALLGELVAAIGAHPAAPHEAVRGRILAHAPQLPPDTQVDAMKLAQYSRQGFEQWRTLFAAKAQEAAARPAPTYLIGHSMFSALIPFVQAHAHARKPLSILMPDMLADAAQPACGYRIQDGTVVLLPKDFAREAGAAIIDDVRNTGATAEAITRFWHASPAAPAPTFEYVSVTG